MTYAQRSSFAPRDDDDAAPWNTWAAGDASDFNVRTRGYGKTKIKAPSAPALYEVCAVCAVVRVEYEYTRYVKR